MKTNTIIAAFMLCTIILFNCKKPKPIIVNEEELITTLTYTLTSTSDTVICKFKDADGDGGNAPVITVSKNLMPNILYKGSLVLLDESGSTPEIINTEIEAEDEAHQFFFLNENALNITTTYDDLDGNQKPIGLKTNVQTGNVSNGKLKITLRHEADKNGANVAQGDITNAGGETDIEVEFYLTIQ
jgi:hypothetical protein